MVITSSPTIAVDMTGPRLLKITWRQANHSTISPRASRLVKLRSIASLATPESFEQKFSWIWERASIQRWILVRSKEPSSKASAGAQWKSSCGETRSIHGCALVLCSLEGRGHTKSLLSTMFPSISVFTLPIQTIDSRFTPPRLLASHRSSSVHLHTTPSRLVVNCYSPCFIDKSSQNAIRAARQEEGLTDYYPVHLPATSERIRMGCTDKFTLLATNSVAYQSKSSL